MMQMGGSCSVEEMEMISLEFIPPEVMDEFVGQAEAKPAIGGEIGMPSCEMVEGFTDGVKRNRFFRLVQFTKKSVTCVPVSSQKFTYLAR